MLKLLRYRPGQALTVALLSTIVVACAAFASLYDRATQQALVDIQLSSRPVQESGLSLTAPNPANLASTVEGLTDLLPQSQRAFYRAPVAGARGFAEVLSAPDAPSPVGLLIWRRGFCAHAQLVEGGCPRRPGELMVSEADAAGFGYRPGTTLRVAGAQATSESAIPIGKLRVVGVYRQPNSRYWFGQTLTGLSGLVDQSSAQRVQHDAWLTPEGTFESRTIPRLPEAAATVQFALNDSTVGIDQLMKLGPLLHQLQGQAADAGFSVSTGLPAIASEVRRQRDQSHTTVPLLIVQLAFLVVVVFWLVLETLTEQRRRELALALLHGRGRRGAQLRLAGELMPAVIAGAAAGCLAAVAACAATTRWFLPGSASVEMRTPPLVAATASLCLLLSLVIIAAWRVTQAPVQSLLRAVGARRTGWAFGALETLVLVASATLVTGFVFGWLSGPVALAGPILLGLMVGLLLAHAIVPLASGIGGWLLRNGRLPAGVSVLGAARSPAARRTVAIVTVATSLTVFSIDAFMIGARNRDAAAAQDSGARLVADVDSTDLRVVRDVLAGIDPNGVRVTPVVRVRAPNDSATQTLAVVPKAFASIALFPADQAASLSFEAMKPPDVTPIRVTGTHISGLIETASLVATGSRPPTVSMVFVDGSANSMTLRLATLPDGSGREKFRVALPCPSGCILTGVQFDSSPGATLSGNATLSHVQVSGRSLTFGSDEDWYGPATQPTMDPSGEPIDSSPPATVTADDHNLSIALAASGGSTVTVNQAWVPRSLPAVVSGRLAVTHTAHTTATVVGTPGSITVNGLDGVARDAFRVATIARIPGSPANTALVNLDYAERGLRLDPQATVSLWFAHDDAEFLERVTAALADAGVSVIGTHTLAEMRRTQNQSLPAWSLQLAAVVGGACVLLALLVLLVQAASTWRLRSRDLASLRMSGVGPTSIRRIAALEPTFAVALAVLAGMACGTVGAQVSLPTVPILVSTPEAFTLDLSPAWTAVALVSAAALGLLGGIAWASGLAVARRAALGRIRETT